MFELSIGILFLLMFVLALLWRRYSTEYSGMLQIKLPDKEEELATDRFCMSAPNALKRYKTAIGLGDAELVQVARKARNCIYLMFGCAIILFILILLHIV